MEINTIQAALDRQADKKLNDEITNALAEVSGLEAQMPHAARVDGFKLFPNSTTTSTRALAWHEIKEGLRQTLTEHLTPIYRGRQVAEFMHQYQNIARLAKEVPDENC